MPLHLEIVTAERIVFEDDVDEVIAPGSDGDLGILPKHAPLLSTLNIGELRLKKAGEEVALAIGGGFLEVYHDNVTVLADAAERSDEIDTSRAEEARNRAQQRVREFKDSGAQAEEIANAEAALRRAIVRLRVAERIHAPRRSNLPRNDMSS